MNHVLKILKIVTLYVMVLCTQFLLAESSEQDLQLTYQAEKKVIADTNAQLETIPTSIKQPWIAALSKVASTLDALYYAAVASLKPLEAQAKSTNLNDKLAAYEQISSITTTAQQKMKQATEPVLTIKQQAATYLQSQQNQENKNALEKQLEADKKLQQAYEEAQKKLTKEIESLQKLYEPFNQAQKAVQTFSLAMHDKPYDAAQVEAIVRQWQAVIDLSFNVYKQFGPINIQDSHNLMLMSLKKMGNFLLDLIYDQLQSLQHEKWDDLLYKALSESSVKLVGTQNPNDSPLVRYGYDGIMEQEIKKYFSDVNQQATLLNRYWKKKIQITFNSFKNGLQRLANTASNPNDEQRRIALNLYNGLTSELAVMSQSNKTVQDDIKLINYAMALLTLNSAQSLLKTLKLDSDNAPLVLKIIAFYNQAATYLTKAGQISQAQENTQLAKNLSNALSTLGQAQKIQKSPDMNKTIDLYKQAQGFFIAGADSLDANKILIVLSDLESKNAVAVAQQQFSQFELDNKTIIEAYLNYSNSLDSKLSIDQIDQFFTNLIQLYQTVLTSCQDAVTTYNTMRTNFPLKTQSPDVQTLNNNLSSAVIVLTALIQAYDALQKGDRLLALKTISDLQDAETTYYQNAVQFFKKVDLVYSTNQSLKTVIPPFFSNKVTESPFNFEILVQRYRAKSSLDLAGQLSSDPVTELAYYVNAYNRKEYLPVSFQTFLSDKINQLSQSKNTTDKLFSSLQSTEKKLATLSENEWAPQENRSFYTSQASQQWEQLLQQYSNLYYSGTQEAKAAFIEAANTYAENYGNYVLNNKELGIALILFQLFILHINDNEEKEALAVKQQIDTMLETSYESIQALLNAVENKANLLTTATLDQKKIKAWADQFDHSLDLQKSALASIGRSLTPEQQVTINIIDKEVKGSSANYSFNSLKKTIELPDPLTKLAELYKQIGDASFAQKDFNRAYSAYNTARQLYTQLGQQTTSDFNQRLALAHTLYLATQYRDLIVPLGSVTVAALQIPESYELKVYGQPVPAMISNQFPNLDFLKTDPAKTLDFLINLAVELYLYNKISDPSTFDKLMPLLSLKNYDDLKNNAIFASLDEDEKIAFVEMVSFAGKMKALFQDRAAKKTMNFVLQQKADKQFVLYIYSLPIPRIIDETTKNYYMQYPSVIIYYLWSANLFKPAEPGQENTTISVGQLSLPHGNDQQEFEAMKAKQVSVYLSEGYSYQDQLKKLQEGTLWQALVKTNKKDMTVVLDNYSDLKATVDNLFNQMYKYYTLPIASGLVTKTDQMYKTLQNLNGATYKNWGDTLANFLVGDPLSFNYVDILQDILKKYIIAITTYNYDTSLYALMAEHHNFAGNLLVEQGKYFDSISYFYTAAALSKNIVPQTTAVKKAIDGYYLNYLLALTQGSTIKMGQFQKALQEPITVEGTDETISFKDLLIKYLSQDSSQGISAQEASTMEDLKNLVLDALIFYNVANSYVTQGISNINEPSLLSWVGVDETNATKVHEAALSLVNTFSKKNNVAFDTISSVTLMMNRKDFPDGKDFVEMINNGFSLFENKVKSSSDMIGRAVGYSALSQFALKLYEAFSYLYMYIYYGEISADAIKNSLKPAIDARTNAILEPSKLYIG